MKWFKRKKEVEIEKPKDLSLLIEYIEEARNLRWVDEDILKKFSEKNYPKELIDLAFEEADKKLSIKKVERRIKMAKKEEEDYDEEEGFEEESLETEEDSEDETLEQEEEKVEPKKKVKVKTSEPKETKDDEQVKPQLTVNDILANHEQRLQSLEARFFRLLNS